MKNTLNIVAGESIPYLQDAFGDLGKLSIFPGRAIRSADLKDTQVLLIRSITPVNETLLANTPVEFVGSASAGADHMDTSYLQSHNIAFTSASGSNANSVAEYVMAALLLIGTEQKFSLEGKTIGIIGVGNIGKLVKQKAEALGMVPILNDPPLAEAGQIPHHSLEETLGCDVVTLHTPLTMDGPYPTHHLLNTHTFKFFKPSAIFINASRGEVVETSALLSAILNKRIGPTIIDVWEKEPMINWDLFQAVTLGTPHIAGHSLDGKANGTFMIYSSLCTHLGIVPAWNPSKSLPSPTVPSMDVNFSHQSNQEQIQEIINQIYDIKSDHQTMQALLSLPADIRPTRFDALRKSYPIRREFHQTALTLPNERSQLRKTCSELGFKVTV